MLWIVDDESQSLSGWDGVFHLLRYAGGVASQAGSQSLSGWDGVFHPRFLRILKSAAVMSRNPFQGGMGFFTDLHLEPSDSIEYCRNPFQGGMGFFTGDESVADVLGQYGSQSLSGWDGVFHETTERIEIEGRGVAIPFRVGWGFSRWAVAKQIALSYFSRNPFQGGMGFFTFVRSWKNAGRDQVAIPFRVGWGFSPDHRGRARGRRLRVAIPFRVGWGFSREGDGQEEAWSESESQSLSGWDGVFHYETGPRGGWRRI